MEVDVEDAAGEDVGVSSDHHPSQAANNIINVGNNDVDDDPSIGIDNTVDQLLSDNTAAPEIDIKKPVPTMRRKRSSKMDGVVGGGGGEADVDDAARSAKNITSYAE